VPFHRASSNERHTDKESHMPKKNAPPPSLIVVQNFAFALRGDALLVCDLEQLPPGTILDRVGDLDNAAWEPAPAAFNDNQRMARMSRAITPLLRQLDALEGVFFS
jgi:hypothetical protein